MKRVKFFMILLAELKNMTDETVELIIIECVFKLLILELTKFAFPSEIIYMINNHKNLVVFKARLKFSTHYKTELILICSWQSFNYETILLAEIRDHSLALSNTSVAVMKSVQVTSHILRYSALFYVVFLSCCPHNFIIWTRLNIATNNLHQTEWKVMKHQIADQNQNIKQFFKNPRWK